MNLYLKYRPQTIDQLDLSGVRDTFNQIIKSNKLSHAYLLTGPRGAGKTSSARILARVVNCEQNKDALAEPCNKCSACLEIIKGSALDVIEIDAASNRGIDDIRELKEKIRLAPVSFRYKVYIIDEVHMLTTEAFNALLKTLEEPPAHSLFILCTTELHKVPETIISRCVQVSFYKASAAELARSLGRVVEGEGIKLDPAIVPYVASRVDGSFRDGVKNLEQVLSYGGEVTLEQVEKILSGGSSQKTGAWVTALVAKDTEKALVLLREIVAAGTDLTYLLVSTMQLVRGALLAPFKLAESKIVIAPSEGVKLVYLLDKTARLLSQAPIPELLVETMVIEWGAGESLGQQNSGPANQSVSKSASQPISAPVKTVDRQASEPVRPVVAEVKEIEAPKVEAPVIPEITAQEEVYQDQIMDGAQLRSLWRKMVANIDPSQASIAALLSKANPLKVVGKDLHIGVAYDFHKAQLETSRFRDNVSVLVKKAFGMPLNLVYTLAKAEKSVLHVDAASANMAEEATDMMDMAEEIFV